MKVISNYQFFLSLYANYIYLYFNSNIIFCIKLVVFNPKYKNYVIVEKKLSSANK